MSGKNALSGSGQLGRSTSVALGTSYSSKKGGGLAGSYSQLSSSTQPDDQTSALFSSPTGVSVPQSKLPVRHKTLASEAFLANAAATEQQMLAAAGRAPPQALGQLASTHQAPTLTVIRGTAPESDATNAAAMSMSSPQRGGGAAQLQSTFGAVSHRVAPARLRASSPTPLELRVGSSMGTPSVSAASVRQLLQRPGSGRAAPSATTVDASGNVTLPALVDGPAGRSFEEELLDIAAQRFGTDASKRHDNRSDASRGPSVLGFSGAGRASTTGLGRTPSPPAGMEDNYEDAVDDAATADFSNPQTATGKPLHMPYTPDIRAKLSPSTTPHSHVTPKPMSLSDYRMLAHACQRAGRARTECHAYYKIAEILSDDRETLPKSIPYFKRYLNLCRRLADLQGEAKALNSLGIVHHRLAGTNNLNIALSFHQQHMEIADAAGIFIAQTNRGLIYRALGNTNEAMECLKQALQYAVRAGDRQAEALALANLGLAGSSNGDFSTARVCVERQLELNTALQDATGSCEAYEHLGALAMQRGDTTGASELLVMALDLALKAGDQATARRVRCQVGVVQSMAKTEERMKAVAQKMGGTGK